MLQQKAEFNKGVWPSKQKLAAKKSHVLAIDINSIWKVNIQNKKEKSQI